MDVAKIPEDLTSEERNSLIDYIQNGCPSLSKVDDASVFGWFELYMKGKSYKEINQITKGKYDLILYMAYKGGWHNKRLDYYNEIHSKYLDKVTMAKMDSVNTTINAISALGKYYDKQFNAFIATNDQSIINNLDTKVLSQYYKSIEMLDKLLSNKTNGSGRSDYSENPNETPIFNININTPKKSDVVVDVEDSVPMEDSSSSAEIIKALAILKRNKK